MNATDSFMPSRGLQDGLKQLLVLYLQAVGIGGGGLLEGDITVIRGIRKGHFRLS
jgi:hypothetical protein